MWDLFIEQWLAQSWVEVVAVALSIVYVVLVARTNLWCWPAALVSTALFSWLFFDVNLLQESLLNIYYLAMAAYGWWHWREQTQNRNALPIQRWSWQKHAMAILITMVIAFCSGLFFDRVADADFPFLNAFTVWFSVLTTLLVARRVLENWVYWLLINPTSVYIFWQKELYATATLMLVYFCLSIYGLYTWTKQWQQQQAKL